MKRVRWRTHRELRERPPVGPLPASRWSDDEVRARVLAIYQTFEASSGRQHYRTAFLLRYDAPPFGVFAVEVGGDAPDSIAVEAFDSLEAARAAAVAWAGEPREVEWGCYSSEVESAFLNAVATGGAVAEFRDRI